MKALGAHLANGFLFTDQYELTMAQLYFRARIHEKEAQFDHFFRRYPDYGSHKAGYCINAGLQSLCDWMLKTRVTSEDIEGLRSMKNGEGERIFGEDFLQWLSDNGHFGALSMEAVPEGRVVHPNTPLTVVRGPLAMAQILESVLLNKLNYQTLIATKAARIRHAVGESMFVDFGMRRAQGCGANAAARAALIGGADFSSNTGVSLDLGYAPKGTHAHSMVQVFMALGADELQAFEQYADVYPDNCILLVDTIDTLGSGVPNAIKVFEKLKRRGHKPVGVRLDSGDLAYLAVQSAIMLNKAGFPESKIVLSNQLDEMVIQQIVRQIRDEAVGAGIDADAIVRRLAYGVGTHLVTSSGAPALDGVYKLVGVKKNGRWKPAIKVSENPAKIPNPGAKKVWRLYDRRGSATADLLALADENPAEPDPLILHEAVQSGAKREMPRDSISGMESLLVAVLEEGVMKTALPDIEASRKQRQADLDRLDVGVRRIVNPHIYHVSVSDRLWRLKDKLVREAAP